MKYNEISNYKIKKYIGHGKSALCFLNEENDVLKIYKKFLINKDLKDLIKEEDIKKLSILNSKYVIAPEEILYKNNNFIGYKTKYINASPISHFNNNIKIKDIVNARNKLIEYISYIANDYSFSLIDVHDNNILYDGNFYIIDLDFGIFDTNNALIKNQIDITLTIIYAMFKERAYELLFNDVNLSILLNELKHNIDTFDIFCNRLYNIFDDDNITIDTLNKNKIKLLKH